MTERPADPSRAVARFDSGGRRRRRVDLLALVGGDPDRLARLPYTLRILLENAARTCGPGFATPAEVARLAAWTPGGAPFAVPVRVSRVLLPDSSGLPALMDLAALRSTLDRAGVDPGCVQPQVPVDVVIDHSVMVDHYGSRAALSLNVQREYERNAERYRVFKWAQGAFAGCRVVPPGMGIVHQVHLERLARVVDVAPAVSDGPPDGPPDGEEIAFPEFVLGGDSHTPMVNGLGVLGWGVGGVEAEAALLGQPYLVSVPRVVGVRLTGTLPPGSTTTDLVLTVTQRLRQVGVVGAFVEFTGPGCGHLSVPDRATIANMAPEYGATAAYFPIDDATLTYLHQTGRTAEQVALVADYGRAAGLFREADAPTPAFDAVVDIDLSAVEPSLAGPLRPQDRLPLRAVAADFRARLTRPRQDGGFGLSEAAAERRVTLALPDGSRTVQAGAVAIAAITACTNTSNPGVMLAAGLLARNAVAAGLSVPGFVKTSLAPGSRVVTAYLEASGLLAPLEALGFYLVGYGCTTCSGKSGPLPGPVARAVEDEGLLAAAVVSSNRNFEGRIHRQVRAAYLASPPLVVAYALAGRVDIDLDQEPLGHDPAGRPVFLRDLWPDPQEVAGLLTRTGDPAAYRRAYATLFDGTAQWRRLDAPTGPLYPWDPDSTYVLEPPFFADETPPLPDTIAGARVLGVFGDALTTDHIAPAGEIPEDSEAGRYLRDRGVAAGDFNAYTMRRGNHHVMARGIFAHARIHNLLVPERSGGVTRKLPEGTETSVHDAAAAYRAEGVPVIVLGGRDYGMGSSRDWAAKGPALLGVRCVLAESFERIHRANLIALGIAPLRFRDGDSRASLGLTGREVYRLDGLHAAMEAGVSVTVRATRPDGESVTFETELVLAAPVEAETLRAGGLFRRVRDGLMAAKTPAPGVALRPAVG
ncbi:aconitate hydratase AcnA [Roseospira goensis]|uniref:Aconitate hydratase n=1 Tax=Roseospira goensis TaxID=391922 RepID=A0A7W6S3A0_9PROT|nr:aconitate hydratase AcnA [Roseospira goensis]MBB4287379.1 aconitate hydratase [Roseospira goensis]